MPDRQPTPHRTATATPVVGHFVMGPDYASWRPGGTDDYLLVYTVAGSGRFGAADGTELTTGPDDIILIRPGTLHDYGTPAGGHWELLWTHFVPRGDWLDLLDWPAAWPGVLRLNNAAAVRPLFETLYAVGLTADPLRDRLVANALEAVLLSCERLNPDRRGNRVDPRLRDALDRIAAGLDQPITVESLAAAVGLSASRLSHLFRDALGLPVMQYVEARRIERAGQLLRMTPLGVKQVARQVGFASPFYFSLRFKKATGKDPTSYRR